MKVRDSFKGVYGQPREEIAWSPWRQQINTPTRMTAAALRDCCEHGFGTGKLSISMANIMKMIVAIAEHKLAQAEWERTFLYYYIYLRRMKRIESTYDIHLHIATKLSCFLKQANPLIFSVKLEIDGVRSNISPKRSDPYSPIWS